MSEDRKADHIEIALTEGHIEQSNFGLNYEPLLSAFPEKEVVGTTFLGKYFAAPIWISSMTGGTKMARLINQNLARACQEFGIGMGLGSCRSILESNQRLSDFDIRSLMPDRALWANLGIAQVEQLILKNETEKIENLLDKLKCDGLIIHINPIQEWLQPEGDALVKSPLWTLEKLCTNKTYSLIVKEVGQGMGPRSLKALCELPLAAIELASFGGTNFADIELKRSTSSNNSLVNAGHSALEMISWLNELAEGGQILPEVIISGGIKNPLQAHALRSKLSTNSVVGLGATVLKHATGEYSQLRNFLNGFIADYSFVQSYFGSVDQ